MDGLLDPLARWARPILLWVPVVLAAGAMVTVMGLTLPGWVLYSIGYLGLLLALAAVVAVHRRSFDWFAWVSIAVVVVGLLIGVPVLVIMAGYYADRPDLHEALMPLAVTPLGMIAGVVTWIGFALFGWAMQRIGAFPTAASVTIVIAAALGLLAEFEVLATVMWGLAVILVAYALVWVAPLAEERAVKGRVAASGADASGRV